MANKRMNIKIHLEASQQHLGKWSGSDMKMSAFKQSFIASITLLIIFLLFRTGIEHVDRILLSLTAPIHIPAVDSILEAILESSISRDIFHEDPIGSTLFWLLIATLIGYRRGWKWLLLTSVALLLSQLISTTIKIAIARQRPIHDIALGIPVLDASSDPGFPSGHVQKSFAAAVVLAQAAPALKRLWYLLGLLVAIERFYVGAHFPFDVLSGIANGITIGLLILHPRLHLHLRTLLWRIKDVR